MRPGGIIKGRLPASLHTYTHGKGERWIVGDSWVVRGGGKWGKMAIMQQQYLFFSDFLAHRL